jgi:hypothetical protein
MRKGREVRYGLKVTAMNRAVNVRPISKTNSKTAWFTLKRLGIASSLQRCLQQISLFGLNAACAHQLHLRVSTLFFSHKPISIFLTGLETYVGFVRYHVTLWHLVTILDYGRFYLTSLAYVVRFRSQICHLVEEMGNVHY